MAKRASYRLVKTHRSYKVDEAARLLGVCKGTIRRWIGKGLPVMQGKKPALIRGVDLKRHLQAQSKPKQKCAPDECRCFKCKSNQKLAFHEAEIIFDQSPTPNLRGLCAECSTVMHKRISKAQIPSLKTILRITFIQADAPISNRPQSPLNDYFPKEHQA